MGVGPSTKETTLHHFRDPLAALLGSDDEFELSGVIVAGISADYAGKSFTAARIGAWISAMNLDGAVVSMDSWGNSHIDFSLLLEQLHRLRMPAVGLCFKEEHSDYILTSRFKGAVIDTSKADSKRETEMVGENTVTPMDARKALAMLKLTARKQT